MMMSLGPGICINWLSNMEFVNSHLGLNIKLSECHRGQAGKVQKTQEHYIKLLVL